MPQVSGVLQSLLVQGRPAGPGRPAARADRPARRFRRPWAEAEGTLARDKAQLDNARSIVVRYRDLLAKDGIPKQQLDTQEALRPPARRHGQDRPGRRWTTPGCSSPIPRVTAPIAGRVGLKQADLGNVVQPADANGIVTITQTRPIALTFAVPAANVPLINTRLRADENVPRGGLGSGRQERALAVGPRGHARQRDRRQHRTPSRSRRCFANTDDALYPNQAVSVILQLDTLNDCARGAARRRAARRAGLLRLRGQRRQLGEHADGAARPDRRQRDGRGRTAAGPGTRSSSTAPTACATGAKVEVIASDPKQRPRRMRRQRRPARRAPGWMSRLPPDVAETRQARCSPEERRALDARSSREDAACARPAERRPN